MPAKASRGAGSDWNDFGLAGMEVWKESGESQLEHCAKGVGEVTGHGLGSVPLPVAQDTVGRGHGSVITMPVTMPGH